MAFVHVIISFSETQFFPLTFLDHPPKSSQLNHIHGHTLYCYCYSPHLHMFRVSLIKKKLFLFFNSLPHYNILLIRQVFHVRAGGYNEYSALANFQPYSWLAHSCGLNLSQFCMCSLLVFFLT